MRPGNSTQDNEDNKSASTAVVVAPSRGGGGEVHLVYDFAEHDLAEMLRCHKAVRAGMGLAVVKSVVWQLLRGLDFLHKNWIIHRDLKPANILVTSADSENPGVVKIADFGLARIFQSPLRRLGDDGDVVTIWYRAPELLLGSKHYTRAIDIWAMGCIFAELLTTTALFPGLEDPKKKFPEGQVKQILSVMGKPNNWRLAKECVFFEQMQALEDYEFKLYEKMVSDWKKLGVSRNDFPRQGHGFALLQRMLEFDPATRITADQALTHPWFKEEPLPKPNVFADKRHAFAYPQRVLKEKLAPDPAARPAKKAAALPTGPTNTNTNTNTNTAANTGGPPPPLSVASLLLSAAATVPLSSAITPLSSSSAVPPLSAIPTPVLPASFPVPSSSYSSAASATTPLSSAALLTLLSASALASSSSSSSCSCSCSLTPSSSSSLAPPSSSSSFLPPSSSSFLAVPTSSTFLTVPPSSDKGLKRARATTTTTDSGRE